jgi:hypothetical protein
MVTGPEALPVDVPEPPPLLEQAAADKASAAAAAIAPVRRMPAPRRTVLFIDLPSLTGHERLWSCPGCVHRTDPDMASQDSDENSQRHDLITTIKARRRQSSCPAALC